jgi:acetyl-CoA carboxylase biotin carboxyl carrier protein
MNLDDVKQILQLMREHELTEFELERDGIKIRVCKNGGAPAIAGAAPPPVVSEAAPARRSSELKPPAAPADNVSQPSTALPPATPDEPAVDYAVVKSPIVGTFYRSPEPGAPAFVEVGSQVKKGQVLCIIEAMKLMNEIECDHDGEIATVYVEDGQPVQYGERLFAIKA